MPYDEGGPDPMGLVMDNISGDWYLYIFNPILLGTQTEPTHDWETEIKDHVLRNLFLIDTPTGGPNLAWRGVTAVSNFRMPSASTCNGQVMVSRFRKDSSGDAEFGFDSTLETVKYVQRHAIATMKLTLSTAKNPEAFDGLYLPVLGFNRGAPEFSEYDRFPVQEVAYGQNLGHNPARTP